MNKAKAIEILRSEDKRINNLNHVTALLNWDYETALPVKGEAERVTQLGLLSSITQASKLSPSLAEAVEYLKDEALSPSDAALVRDYLKFYRREANLPVDFVRELSESEGRAHAAWIRAREENNWLLFEDELANLVKLSKEKASITDPRLDVYDAQLDLYEEGMRREVIDPLFKDLKETVLSLMDKAEGKEIKSDFLLASYDEKTLHAFCLDVIDNMGFDSARAVVSRSVHPFTTTLGEDDVRITTRYTDPSIMDPISTIVHECGHALYELGAASNPDIRGTTLSDGASMGVHESQSRFWENIIGKSFAFWKFEYPKLQKAVPSLASVPLEDFYKAINKIESSAIRVNADEVTYNLHIILRYEVEKALFSGDVAVCDLPAFWNEKSKEILHYEPKSEREGILQDCHWAQNNFGYFPTYSLGNLYGAMFRSTLVTYLGGEGEFERIISSGDWREITTWQKNEIWQYGKIFTPSALLYNVTGRILDGSDFKEYLIKKYDDIY